MKAREEGQRSPFSFNLSLAWPHSNLACFAVAKESVRQQDARLRDVALACRRAGKTRAEGAAFYNMGVLYDNQDKFLKAVDAYKT